MLTGDLSDFSLREVLEFLSAAGKSGLLTIRCAGIDGGVFLCDGGVCLALVDVTRVPLGPRMIALGLVDRETLREAGGTAGGTTFALVCGVMRAAVDAGEANMLAVDHTRDAVGWLNQLDNATFVFDSTVTADAWPFAPLPVEQLLVAAEGSAARWAELRETIDDLSLVPSSMVDPSSTIEVSLTAPQWRVIALTDGRRSVNEIIELSGLGQLETCRELAGLIDGGLVELVRPGGHSLVDTLLHDVRAVDAFAFGRGAPTLAEPFPASAPPSAGADPGRIATIADTGAALVSPEPPHASAHPVHQRGAALDAHSAVTPEHLTPAAVPPEVNVGLLNRLIDGARRR